MNKIAKFAKTAKMARLGKMAEMAIKKNGQISQNFENGQKA